MTKTFSLPAAITIETVNMLHGELKQLLSDESAFSLTVDAAQTEIITTPGIQLLLSLDKALKQSGSRMVLSNAPEIMKKSFQGLGLEAQLGKWCEGNA